MATILTYRGITPTIDETAFVGETAVVTGDVEVGANSSIWYGCVVRGDVNRIRIGCDVNIQDATVVHVSDDFETRIGDRVTIGHMALIHACTLEDDSFVGMKACIMDGAVVEKGAMVAAGALVTPGKRVLAGELWAGSPAKKIRDVGEKDQAVINHIHPRYVALAAEYKKIEEEGE